MRSVPGIAMRGGPSRPVRILCPKCKACMGVLPPGTRVALAGTPSTSTVEGTCECGYSYRIRTVEDGP